MFGVARQKYIIKHSLGVVSHASVQLDDVIANKPNQIAEIRCSCPVPDEREHGGILNAINVQCQRSHGNTHHSLGMVEELYCFRVKGKIVCMLK